MMEYNPLLWIVNCSNQNCCPATSFDSVEF